MCVCERERERWCLRGEETERHNWFFNAYQGDTVTERQRMREEGETERRVGV